MNDEILKRLDILAAKLGIAASHLWSVLLRQQFIVGIEAIVWGVLEAVIASVSLKIAFRWIRILQDDDGYPRKTSAPNIVGTIALLVVGVISTIASIVNLASFYGPLLNPEFYAFQDLIKIVAGK